MKRLFKKIKDELSSWDSMQVRHLTITMLLVIITIQLSILAVLLKDIVHALHK